MFILRHLICMAALLGFLVAPALADEAFSLKGGYANLNPSGEFVVSTAGSGGDVVDIEKDLDIGRDDAFFAEAALQLGAFQLFASYLPISFSGSSVLSQDIVFKGETFVEGHRVESDVDLDIYEAGLTWYLVNFDDLPLRLQFGPEIAVKYIDTKVELQDKPLLMSEAETAGVPLPSLGARARIALADFLGVVARVGYVKLDDNSFMDIDARMELSPLPLVAIFAGYRYLDMEIDEGDLYVDAKFSGPHAGALVRF